MSPLMSFRPTPWIRRLLAANVVVFFLQETVFSGPWAVESLGFAPAFAFRQPWAAVTYMFLHGDLLHLAVNMLMFFMFGSAVEDRLGSRTFLWYYLVSGLGGAALSLLMVPILGSAEVRIIGASAAVFGVALAFVRFWPDEPIFVFPLPVPVKAKWLVAFFATVSLAGAIWSTNDDTAHLAHLGGFLFGYLFLRLREGSTARAAATVQRVVPTRVLVHPAAARRGEDPPPPRQSAEKDETRVEIDRVLDKISAQGFGSLSADERRFLMEISKRLRQES